MAFSRLFLLLLALSSPMAGAYAQKPDPLSPAEAAALQALGAANATNYELIDSWFQGRAIQYYHFGPSAIQPAGLYRVQNGGMIVSTIPGLPGYSALVQVFDVELSPAAGQDPATITSRETILRLLQIGRARLKPTGVILNLPIVPEGSTLERDPADRPLEEVFYKGRVVHYFDFGRSRPAAIPLISFASAVNADGVLEPVEGQASNASGIPGLPGYSDLWAVEAAIGAGYLPGSYRDYTRALADARSGKLRLRSRGVQNCPVVYVEGRPAGRSGAPLAQRDTQTITVSIAPAGTITPSQVSGPTAAVPPAASSSRSSAELAGSKLYSGVVGRTAVRTPRENGDITIDGILDEPVWVGAAKLTHFSQYQPVDGRPAEDSTEVLVWYSPTAIHFGVRAYEAHGSVHATLASRDRISGDDFVQILLDTFNDQRRALVFGTNPLGIQSDGTLSEGAQARSGGLGNTSSIRDTVDLSVDFVFQSKGRVTDWGYEVEISIPFKTLRYQSAEVQVWGFNVVRKVQHSGYENTWTPVRQANPSFLGQAGRLEGLTGISRGLVLDLNPEVTGKANGTSSVTGWNYDTSRPEVGGNVRWGITNNLTLAGTADPDYSQVEADVQQVIADPRSAVNYPEKRPFFLEGAEQFDTPNQLIYTRRLVNPVAAWKLAGKLSGTGIGLLVGADDKALSTSKLDNPWYGMFRMRRDVGQQSSVGLTSTTKLDGSNYSQLAGADMKLTFARAWTAQMQGVETVTRTAGTTVTGPMWQASLDRAGRKYRFNYNMSGFHPNFLPAAGFQRRTNIANASMTHRFATFGAPGATIEGFTFDLNVSSNWWYKNNNRFLNGLKPNDPKLHFTGNMTLRGGWRIGGATYFEYFSYDPGLYSTYRMVRTLPGGAMDTIPYVGVERLYNVDLVANASTPQFKWGAATLSVITGQDENFFEWSKAWIWLITATADLRPTDKIRLNARYVRQLYLRASDGSTVGDRQIPRLKVEYQLSRAVFLRLVAQYDIRQQDSLRDDSRTNVPVLFYDGRAYRRAVMLNTNNLRMDWLFSFQPSPGTVLFAGYGSSLTETDAFTFRDIQRTGDGFFMKLSYLLRL